MPKMKSIDKWISGLLIGFIIFITCFCAGWWSFYLLKFDAFIGMYAGIVIGIVLNYFFLKKIINKIYEYNYYVLALIYLFYNIGIFGFFMGVPVFNILMGPIAGWYIGKRMCINHNDYDTFKRTLRNTNFFCLCVMLLICIASATLALLDNTTAANLKGMLNLNFEVTQMMIIWIIIIGGLFLIISQYFLTKYMALKFYKKI